MRGPIAGQYVFAYLRLAQGKSGAWWILWRRKGRGEMMSRRLG